MSINAILLDKSADSQQAWIGKEVRVQVNGEGPSALVGIVPDKHEHIALAEASAGHSAFAAGDGIGHNRILHSELLLAAAPEIGCIDSGTGSGEAYYLARSEDVCHVFTCISN